MTDFNAKEFLIPLSTYNIDIFPILYHGEMLGAYKDCYVRRTVANLLLKVKNELSSKYKLVILDGYRSRQTHEDYCDVSDFKHQKNDLKYLTGGVITAILVDRDLVITSLEELCDIMHSDDNTYLKSILEKYGFVQEDEDVLFEFEFGTEYWAKVNNVEHSYSLIEDIEYSDRVIRGEEK